MAILCVLHNDDSREGQPDDIALCSDTVEIGFFGSKIYPPLLGQIIRMPRLTRRGLPRTGLRAPYPSSRSSAPGSPALVWPERLSSALLPRRQLGILGHWPQEVRDLAIPLYKRSLLLHSVPSLKWLLAVPILEGTDLSAPLSNRQSRFRHLAKRVLAEAYAATTGAGAHRFQRGGIAELSHGRAGFARSIHGSPPRLGALRSFICFSGRSLCGDRRRYARRRPQESRPRPDLPCSWPSVGWCSRTGDAASTDTPRCRRCMPAAPGERR